MSESRMAGAMNLDLKIVEHDGTERPLLDLISESEIIINGTYQDANDPVNFVIEEEKSSLRAGH